MNFILGTIVMTVILFCLSILIKSHQKTLLYYIIISLVTLCVTIIFSYEGDINRFIIDYLLPLIIPIIIFEIILYIKNKKLADEMKNHKIILFQLQKIISLISSIATFNVLVFLIILKYVFSFSISIILIFIIGLALVILIGLTIALYRYKQEKIVVVTSNEVYQYEIPPKIYTITRNEIIDQEAKLNATIFWNHNEVHYVFILDKFTSNEFFEKSNSLYHKVIPLISINTYTIINVSVIQNKISKIVVKHQKSLKNEYS